MRKVVFVFALLIGYLGVVPTISSVPLSVRSSPSTLFAIRPVTSAYARPPRKRRASTRKPALPLPAYYRHPRWLGCKHFEIPVSKCRAAWRTSRIAPRHALIIALLAWWKRDLENTPQKTLDWLAKRREKYFRVGEWWFDRRKSDKIYHLLEMIDTLLQPHLDRYPQPLYREILQKTGALLDHPAMSMPRQTALTSRLSRWLARRTDAPSIESIRTLMQRSMLRHRECPWWFLVFLQTFAPDALARFSKQKISPSWCTARRLHQEIRFRTPEASDALLRTLAKRYPRHTRLVPFGKSYEGRTLWALHIHAKRRNPNAKSVLMVGAQHADEHMGTEILLDLAQTLLKKHKTPHVRELLDRIELWLIPVLNPDGKHFDLAGGVVKIWRYNRSIQPDGQIGVDLNRNYDDHWQPFRYVDRGRVNLPGLRPFSEPETDALRQLAEKLPRLTALLDLHQYGRVVLLPYAYAKKPLPNDFEDLFYKIGQYLIETNRYRTFPAHRLYPHQGTLGDWGFSRFKALSLVLEIGSASYLKPTLQAHTTRQDLKLIHRFLSIADDPFQKIRSIPLPPPDPRLVRRTTYTTPTAQ
ncbi:M14 family metallopeptidase [Myxococcota bacterium]|nr:M14 family metallopeptidase [Myxococcota bacterium]